MHVSKENEIQLQSGQMGSGHSPTGFLCGRPIGLELIARVSERPGRRQRQFQETVKDVSVCNVLMHTAH